MILAMHAPDGFLTTGTAIVTGVISLLVVGFALRQSRSQLRDRHIDLPVIALSADDDDESQRSARELGARLFLHKPTDNQALLDAIQWLAGARV